MSKQLHDGFASFQEQPNLGEGLTDLIVREKYLNIFSVKYSSIIFIGFLLNQTQN